MRNKRTRRRKGGYKENMGQNARNQLNRALLRAAELGHVEEVRELIANPAVNINVRSQGDQAVTPLFMASQGGHTDIVRLLLEDPRIEVNTRITAGLTPFYIAVQMGHIGIVRLFLANESTIINRSISNAMATPLIKAAEKGYTEIVRLLLADSRITSDDINKGVNGITALGFAVYNGHRDIVRLLLADPRTDVNKENPLMLALKRGHVEICRLLIEDPRTDVNMPNTMGATPLFAAAYSGSVPLLRALLAHPQIVIDDLTRSALEDGAFSDEIAEILRGAM